MQNKAIRIVKTRLPDGDSNPWSFYFSRQTRCYSIGPRVNRGLAFFSAGQKERFRQEKVWQMGCEGCEGCEALNGFFRIGQLKLRPTLSEWQWPGWPDEFVTKTAQNLAQMHLHICQFFISTSILPYTQAGFDLTTHSSSLLGGRRIRNH
jgi:hypothetical protein